MEREVTIQEIKDMSIKNFEKLKVKDLQNKNIGGNMDYIKLKEKKDIYRLGIIDENGNIVKDNNGNEVYLEFDMGDIELPLKYNKCINLINQARQNLKAQFIIIDKRKDHKGKKLLSSNEEAKAKAIKQFYIEMEKAMDLFLGEGGTKKYLNGKTPYWEMWDDISEVLEPHLNKMKLTVTDMTNRIKEKYKVTESDVLTNE